MKLHESDNSVIVSDLEYFDAVQTFDCGQCFRFEVLGKNIVEICAFGKKIRLFQPSADTLVLTPCTSDEFYAKWQVYLGLCDDYTKIRSGLACLRPLDFTLKNAMNSGMGIRILHQEPWETLCSFIISQNNNIPRIKKNIADLCTEFGENGSFPTAKTLANVSVDELRTLKVGFRAPYIKDAAVKVAEKVVDFDNVVNLSLSEAVDELTKIKGVGVKVANCTLLFGFGKLDAFPIDVWMKRVLNEFYSESVCGCDFGEYAGIAQQYLFYYRRYLCNSLGKK